MTRKILLADDSATIRKVVELTFSDEDVQITAVADGALALERARAERPDIVIADTVMPVLDGFQLCERMKSDPSLRTVPFLLLRGSFEAFEEERARACGAEGSVAKPFESQEMVRKVNELIAAGVAPATAPAPQLPVQPPAAPRSAAPAPARIAVPPAPPQPAHVPPPAPAMAPSAPAFAAPAVPARPAPPPPPPPPPPPATPPPPPPRFPAVAPPPVPPAPPPPPAAPRAPAVMPPPPPPARPVEMPSQPSSPFADEDFDLGPVPAEPAAAPGADDDLWSEVNLRGGSAPIIDPAVGEDNLWGSLADTSVLDEREAPAPLRKAEAPAEPPPATAPPPLAAAKAAPPPVAAIDGAEIERLVAARVETAVRQALERLVGGSARSTIEDIAWQVVPELAEAMIKAEIERVARASDTG